MMFMAQLTRYVRLQKIIFIDMSKSPVKVFGKARVSHPLNRSLINPITGMNMMDEPRGAFKQAASKMLL